MRLIWVPGILIVMVLLSWAFCRAGAIMGLLYSQQMFVLIYYLNMTHAGSRVADG